MIHGNVLPQRQNESTRLRGERDRKIENFAQIRFRHGFYNSLTAMRITIVPAATRQVLAFTFPVTDWFADGATAEFCITLPQNIARKPATLSHEVAASVPIGALTSWQGLIDRAKVEPGRARIGPRRRGRSWALRCASGAYPRCPSHHYCLRSGHRFRQAAR